jgi:hypothetical protein
LELYNLAHDPIENIDLIVYGGSLPTPMASSAMPVGVKPHAD